ncbi:hypothetical protein ACE6H2_015278 [Prunus campanulata]
MAIEIATPEAFPIRSIILRLDGGSGLAGQQAQVGGWVKTSRKAAKDAFAFLELNDSSCASNLQIIVEANKGDLGQLVLTGTCLQVDCVFKLAPYGKKQKMIAIARIRDELSYATKTFFQERGFYIESAKLIVKQRGNDVAQLKFAKASKQEIGVAMAELQKAKENALKLEERSKLRPAGELIGGSQREERYDVMLSMMKEMGLPIEPYEWCLDLRLYGTVKHCGFGLGFEHYGEARTLLEVEMMQYVEDAWNP